MSRIDQSLARLITRTGGLSSKAENSQRLAGALTAARKHEDIDARLQQVAPRILQKVVRDASTALRVSRVSNRKQQKIPKVITAEAQLAFENRLRSILGLAKPDAVGPSSQRPPADSVAHASTAPQRLQAGFTPKPRADPTGVRTGVGAWVGRVFKKPKPAPEHASAPRLVGAALADRLAQKVDVNVRAQQWQKLHGGDDKAEAYNKGFWSAAVSVKERLERAPRTPATAVLKALAQQRHALAVSANAADMHEFGREARSPLATLMNNDRYGQFPSAKALTEKIIAWDRHYTATGKFPPDIPANILPRDSVPGASTGYVLTSKDSSGNDLRLSLYAVEKDVSGRVKTFADGTPKVSVNGGSGDRPELAEIERLYAAAVAPLAPGLSTEQRLQAVAANIGRLHYLLAHKPQFARGSAGIYDMLTAALFLRHNFVFPGWKPFAGGDIEALSSFDAEHYARNYLSLMRGHPEELKT